MVQLSHPYMNPGKTIALTRWTFVGNVMSLLTYGRNTNNLRYADDTTLMAESKEELKSLLMKMREESEKGGLKLNIPKKKQTNSTFRKLRSWHLVPSLHGK